MALVHCMLLAGERALETLVSNEDVLHLAKVFLASDCLLLLWWNVPCGRFHVCHVTEGGGMSVGVVLTQATGNLWMHINRNTWIHIKGLYNMTVYSSMTSYNYWNLSLNMLCHIRDHGVSNSSFVMIDQPNLQGRERGWNFFSFESKFSNGAFMCFRSDEVIIWARVLIA